VWGRKTHLCCKICHVPKCPSANKWRNQKRNRKESWKGIKDTADSGHMFLLVGNCPRPLKTCHFLRAAAVYFKIGRVAPSPHFHLLGCLVSMASLTLFAYFPLAETFPLSSHFPCLPSPTLPPLSLTLVATF